MLKDEKTMKKSEFKMSGKLVFFATSNFNKFSEVRMILREYDLSSAMLSVKTVEIQNDSLAVIAKTSVIEAFRMCHLPVIVEDAGLFIQALKGFPGPYSAYVYKTISNRGMLRLMEKVENREATFRSVIAYCDGTAEPVCFEGEADGEISYDERWGNGKAGFGFDPIFIPRKRSNTFAEMDIKEKNLLSHRAKSVCKFAKWYRKQLLEKSNRRSAFS